jgi:hypothetical protein
MTLDEWVEAALAARLEQGLPVEIEDPATLDFLADLLGRVTPDVAEDRTAPVTS